MLLDIGGGTTDIVIHAFGMPSGKRGVQRLSEIARGDGGACGGANIDAEFLKWARTRIPGLDKIERDHPSVFNAFMMKWDSAKRFFNNTRDVSSISLPPKIQKLMEDEDIEELEISREEMKSFFDPVIKTVYDLTIAQVKGVEQPVRALIMVGGLSESAYVEDELRHMFEPHFEHVFTPPKAGGIVVRGAVFYGLEPQVITQRVQRQSVFVRISAPTEPGDREEFIFVHKDKGTPYTRRLDPFVLADAKVFTGTRRTKKYYPIEARSESMTLPIYSSPFSDSRYTNDVGVREMGIVEVEIPDTRHGLNRPACFDASSINDVLIVGPD